MSVFLYGQDATHAAASSERLWREWLRDTFPSMLASET